jgi:hypothetical protein
MWTQSWQDWASIEARHSERYFSPFNTGVTTKKRREGFVIKARSKSVGLRIVFSRSCHPDPKGKGLVFVSRVHDLIRPESVLAN